MHTVAVAVVEDSGISLWELYELSIACTVFGIPHPDLADPWYDLRLCSAKTNAPTTGFSLSTPYGLDALAGADTVIVPSVPGACPEGGEDVPPELVEALCAAVGSGARMVSLCTGAFALAAAGLLDGRRAATAHWQHTAALAERYPEVLVDDSVLYTDDGNVLTSAAATAALDLCLHLVRRDLGERVANQLARRLVVPAHRTGGQAQFIDQPVPATDDDNLGPALQWATARPHEPLTVDDMARRARMSPRTFYRRLQESTGTTPLQWLLACRLAHAQSLLESTDLPIDRISAESGLGSAANLRRHFTLQVGVSPSDYRRSFALSDIRLEKAPERPA